MEVEKEGGVGRHSEDLKGNRKRWRGKENWHGSVTSWWRKRRHEVLGRGRGKPAVYI
jgi:hypothetical protein